MQEIFQPDVLVYFGAVEEFHRTLAATRVQRFMRNLARMSVEHLELESGRKRVTDERDAKLHSLHGKRALDEYSALAQQEASFNEEKMRLERYLNFFSRN
jgi:uncharacterized protein YydD (DUF2326 family)